MYQFEEELFRVWKNSSGRMVERVVVTPRPPLNRCCAGVIFWIGTRVARGAGHRHVAFKGPEQRRHEGSGTSSDGRWRVYDDPTGDLDYGEEKFDPA